MRSDYACPIYEWPYEPFTCQHADHSDHHYFRGTCHPWESVSLESTVPSHYSAARCCLRGGPTSSDVGPPRRQRLLPAGTRRIRTIPVELRLWRTCVMSVSLRGAGAVTCDSATSCSPSQVRYLPGISLPFWPSRDPGIPLLSLACRESRGTRVRTSDLYWATLHQVISGSAIRALRTCMATTKRTTGWQRLGWHWTNLFSVRQSLR